MGGDNSPSKSVKGVGLFLSKNKFKNDFIINLFGDEKQIRKVLNENKIISNNLVITHTDSVVSDDETPLTAIKNSKNTSMWNCIKSQIDGEWI